MSIQYAQDIVRRLGPGRITLDRALYEDLAVELALIGCDVQDLDGGATDGAVLLDWSDADDGAATLTRAQAFETLALRPGASHRAVIEPALFEAGWRRHPAGMMPGMGHEWSNDDLPATVYYQRAEAAAGTGPLTAMDASADAFIARYAQMSTHVRSGDHVLIDDVAAPDAIAILSALSRGGTFEAGGMRAAEGEVFRLDHIADNSLDLVLAFAPPADNWQIALAEYARVLRLDGRLIIGWPRGKAGDHAPADWPALAEFAEQLFVIETRYVQSEADRALFPVDLDAPSTNWIIMVASMEPLDGAAQRDGFTHPGFPQDGPDTPVLVDFAQAYDNPWLYRTMIQMGERIADPVKLAQLAEHVIADSLPDSADRGAALGVLGYRVLELRMRDAVAPLIDRIDSYWAATDSSGQPPHVVRWRISLAYLAGRLCELAEDRAGALEWYDLCAAQDWAGFSPILATKTIGASFFGARLCLAARDMAGATMRFERGVAEGLKVTAADHGVQIGRPEAPVPFYFTELAEVIDMASQCANALACLPLFDRDPGLYWRQVDTRRFGLASWALDLQRENDRLRRMR